MAKEKYGVRSGYRIKGNPQDIGEELTELRKRHGERKPEIIWKAARKKTSALHNEFTWNVKKAAEKCWVEEALYVTQAITVTTYQVIGGETQKVEVRAFQGVIDEMDKPFGPVTYYTHAEVHANQSLYDRSLKSAVLYLQAAVEKYGELTELENVWKEIRKLDINKLLKI